MVEKATVRRLLRVIETRLARLHEFADVTLDEYLENLALQDRVERNFEVCIQACIDLGSHIVADFMGPMPETYRDVFGRLAELSLLPPDLGKRLQAMAGFRNLLVHGYAEIVAAKAHQNLHGLHDIHQYVQVVTRYLVDQGAFDA